MLKQLYFDKRYTLVAGTLLLLVISYQFAFKKTLGEWTIHRQLQAQTLQSTDIGFQPDYLERKHANLQRILAAYQTDSAVFRSNLVAAVAQIAQVQQVRLTGVPPQSVEPIGSPFILQQVNLEGSYPALLKVFDQLQATPNIGIIRSAKIQSIKDNVSGIAKLVMTLSFQAITGYSARSSP
jgi:hypothetical protein